MTFAQRQRVMWFHLALVIGAGAAGLLWGPRLLQATLRDGGELILLLGTVLAWSGRAFYLQRPADQASWQGRWSRDTDGGVSSLTFMGLQLGVFGLLALAIGLRAPHTTHLSVWQVGLTAAALFAFAWGTGWGLAQSMRRWNANANPTLA